MRVTIWIGLIFALGISFLGYIDSPRVRHGSVLGLGSCSVKQYYMIPEKPDLLTFGSSRVRQGISPESIKTASKGQINSVYNLGRSGISTHREFIILRDLLEKGIRPRAVFIELDIDSLLSENDSKFRYIPENAVFMKYSDLRLLLESSPALTHNEELRMIALSYLEKIRGAIATFVSGAPFTIITHRSSPPTHCRVPKTSTINLGQHIRARIHQAHETVTSTRPTQNPSNTKTAQRTLFFINKIRALCKDNGISLIIARPGAVDEVPLSAEQEAIIRATVPEFVQPADQIVRRTWNGFDDETHMGHHARVVYSTWVAELLLSLRNA